MTEEPVHVEQKWIEHLCDAFSPRAVVELVASVAFQNFSARFNDALDIQVEQPHGNE